MNLRQVWLFILILISLLLKVWVWNRTYVINPDGFEYTSQAKLIYLGNYKKAKTCGKRYISLYQPLIAGTYFLFKDWVFSARLISLLFAVACIIPIYFSFLLICDKKIAFLSSLLFAVNPFLCRISTEIIKDQLFWFLLSIGILCSLKYIREKKNHFFLLSCFFFLLSGFARMEGFIVAVSSAIIISMRSKNKKLFIFFASVIVFLLIPTIPKLWSYYLRPRFELLLLLKNFSFKSFFELIPHLLGGILYVFSIPFLLLFFWGIKGLKCDVKKEEYRYLLYLCFVCFLPLLVYFTAVCYSKRYLSVILICSFLFIAPCISYLFNRWKHIKASSLMVAIAIFIVATSLAYNVKERRKEKLIYKRAGEYVASVENKRFVNILCSDRRINVYANKENLGVWCNAKALTNIDILKQNRTKIQNYFEKNVIKYVFIKKEFLHKTLPFLVPARDWKKRESRYILFRFLNKKNL